MRWTQTLIPSLRNVPKDAEALSHQLALRAGLIRQLASGVYSYLPLGFRVLHKVIGIIREEMNKAGASEVLLPALHPAEIWKKSGRYETLGEDKIAFKNRAGHEFVLGPTHEEVITDLVGTNIKSFRDLPLTLYQIQTKFRDEARPRFGVIRTKEFIMKDAYSFDRDEAGLDSHYQKMRAAYHNIFNRCGLKFQVVSADTGMMGGKMSQEFMVICPYGEDRVASSESGYLASQDIAERARPELSVSQPPLEKPEPFDTPNLRTIDEISHRFKIAPSRLIKTLIFIADDRPVAALVTGDSEVNEGKLRKLIGAKTIRQAEAHEIREATGAPVGFAGPVGLKIPMYADWDVTAVTDGVTGANEKDKHLRHVAYGRDFTPVAAGDIRFVKDGDLAPDGKGRLTLTTSMEIGHIFKLGTRYSESIGATFLDEKGERKPAIMGCYGIGVNRILAATIEQHHDEKGIKWPSEIAPFQVEIITINQADLKITTAAERLYDELNAAGVEVLYDDRDERAGVKFNDADLIGIPRQVVIGERNLAQGKVEIKDRQTGLTEMMDLCSVVSSLS
ncbi:MAG: proline--tRNA ligase [Candidatus Omnitrophota bacterium]|jgi:prolyl-tRNA synthetase